MTTKNNTAGPHVAVIGAGAFGGWTALTLLRRGLPVTLVDAWGPGNSRASSGGETRVIRALYTDPKYVGMAGDAMAQWRRHERRTGRRFFFVTGLICVARSAGRAFIEAAAAALAGGGVDHEAIDPTDVARRFPQLSAAGVEAALYEPGAGYLLARKACASVVDAFVAEGGRYVQAPAMPEAADGGRMARIRLTGDATLAADRFVFACGPWLPAMFPDVLGSHVAVTRQEVYFFGPPKDAGTSWSGAMPVFADVGERFWYGLPDIERRGVKICDDTHGPAFDPTDGARVATSEGIAAARAFLAERLPRLADAPLLESRVCQYTVTPHEDFFIDRHPGFDNVWLAGGGSGHAFKHGPILGEIAADRALGVPNRPGQFTSPT